MAVRQRRRAKPVTVAVNTDYSEQYPSGLYRSVNLKMSGTMAASGAGTNAGDGPFNLLGRVEYVRGGDPVIAMHGADLRHLSAFLCGAQPEILPASIADAAVFLAQAELPLDKLLTGAAIDARGEELVIRGRFRGITNLGTTVTAISTGKLRASGETTELDNGDHFEPRFTQQTIDISTSSSDLVTTKRIGSDVEIATAIMLRVYDASTELSNPNSYRSDGHVREVRVEIERAGKPAEEVGRWTWAELKQMSTTRYGVSAATGQIQTGVVLLTLDDPETPELDDSIRLERGDAIIIRVDTAATIEDEFTAITPAAGDLLYCTFLNFVPRGPGVDEARAVRSELRRQGRG